MIWPGLLSSTALPRSLLSRALRSAAGVLRPRGPRLWRTEGGVQIETRRLGRPGTATAARAAESALREVPGVSRAEVNGALGCVYVGCGPETDLDRLVAAVTAADGAAAGKAGEGEGRAVGFPGAGGARVEAAVQMGAGMVGVGAASAGGLLRWRGLPPVVLSVVQLAEATPRVREAVARRLGESGAERGWAVANLLLNTLTFRPIGAALGVATAGARYAEARARHRVWQEWAHRLAAHEGAYRHDAVAVQRRPAALPPGPGERYARVAVPAAVGGYGLTALGTFSHDRGLALLAAGTPRGPRYGKEAFASSVARTASERGALVLRPEALRRLDRIDTVVLDARVLATGGWTVEHVVRLGPRGSDLDDDEVHARIHELLEQGRRRAGWELRPFGGEGGAPEGEGEAAAVPRETAAQAARWAGEGVRVLLVVRKGTPVAVAGLVPQLHALSHHLVRAARACGEVRLVGGPAGLHHRFGLAQAHPTGRRRTVALVRSLQARGHGVAVVSARARCALAQADLGVGVLTGPRRVPWDAPVAAPPEVAHLLLTALPEARRVGVVCSRLEGAGAAVGSALALLLPRPGAWARVRLLSDAVTVAGMTTGFWAARRLSGRPVPAVVERTPWHAMTVRQVMGRLGSGSRGLDEAEAARRREGGGRDRRDGAVTFLGRFAEELANPVTPVLAVGGGISAALGSVVDSVLIGGVLGVDALVGGVQQQKADRAARRLVEATSVRVRVRRADRAEAVEAAAEDLVAGDVVELDAGDAVPADCRVVRATGLEADESSLTGESLPVLKTAAPNAARAVADRTSMLYQGTTVAAGHALAVVVATGSATEAGGAAEAGPEGGPPESGVERRLKALGRWFLPMSVAAGVALFAVDVLRRRPLGAALGSAVSLCVAAVPEGLPFVATVAELAAARRLSGRDTLVRSASTIEALGRTDVLCFDKTGTLTEGRISLQQVSDGRERRPPERLTPSLRRVLATAALAGPPGPAAGLAHPTDRAIAAGAELLGIAPARAAGFASETWERVTELPFEPARGFHAVLGRSGGRARIVVKGAPEVVLARCERIRRGGGPSGGEGSGGERASGEAGEPFGTGEPFGGGGREEIEAEVDRLARQGLRVLAVAERVLPSDAPRDDAALAELADVSDDNLDGLCLLGLLGLADPVRATASESVRRLAKAGVRIVMVTGDHPSTAAAIARELRPEEEPRLMTGAELEALDEAALARTLPEITVFARVTPAHKVRIVTALRSAGRTVAVTGDGANDAPAIRIADVGIALGSRATPAARSAADVVVTDDRIETIVDAIVEGRAMWASVRKALGILLGGNVGEIVFTLATSVLTGGSALNARQLLLVNVLTDMLPALAIAARPPAERADKLLAEGPEASLGAALTRQIRARAVVTTAAATVAWVIARATGTRGHADTVALVALVSSQLFQTLADAGRDPVVALAVVGSLLTLAVVVTVPGLSHFFGNRPLGPVGWTIALGAAVAWPAARWVGAGVGRIG
ncbi:HAD-IC family P-type ATPase [Streptomyces sp. NPDC002328]|uniref:cation-translocating P-type ATPase n=1 Tax=Streptomyces sp. NPDC002328 TaxID=3364642 RepID=UPI0036C2E266